MTMAIPHQELFVAYMVHRNRVFPFSKREKNHDVGMPQISIIISKMQFSIGSQSLLMPAENQFQRL